VRTTPDSQPLDLRGSKPGILMVKLLNAIQLLKGFISYQMLSVGPICIIC